jgi:ClpP class serine protease
MAKEEEPGDPSTIAAAEGKEDLYLYNGPINEVGYLELIRAVSDPHHAKKAILLITTYGGSAESGYKIARWFQRFYEEFWLYPTSVCASAGTLIAMGAHGLYMSPFSELGPLDVQLAKRNELGEYKSGLVTKAALEKLRDEALRFWENFMLEIKRKGGRNITFDTCANIATAVC